MDYFLAGTEFKLTYLEDRRARARIDWPAVLDDLSDAGAPANRLHWCDLDDLTHVVLATDRITGQYAGVIGLVGRTMRLEPYLQAEAAMVRPGERGANLLRAMLAHILVRTVSLNGKPTAVVAARRDRSVEWALADIGRDVAGAGLHPVASGNVIAFQTASLARRLGPDISVLDLRPITEASLLRDLRKMHRVRRGGVKPPAAMVKLARNGGATRRPRTAIHTGRNG